MSISISALDTSGFLCSPTISGSTCRRRRRPIQLSGTETEKKNLSKSQTLGITRIASRKGGGGALSFWNNTNIINSLFIFIIYVGSTIELSTTTTSNSSMTMACRFIVTATAFAPLRTTTTQRRLKTFSTRSGNLIFLQSQKQQQQQQQPLLQHHHYQTFASTKTSSQEVSTETTTNNNNNNKEEESPLGISSSAPTSHDSLLDTTSSNSNSNITSSSSSIYLQPARIGGCQALLDLELPEGRCIGLQLADNLSERDALTAEAIQRDNDKNDHWLRDLLHPQEIDYGLQVYSSDAARQSFWMGRMALRRALEVSASCQQTECSLQLLQQLYSMNDFKKQNHHHHDGSSDKSNSNSDCIVLLKDEHGRPKLPPGALGSISHKKNTAVALVQCRRDDDIDDNDNNDDDMMQMGIGVDIELTSMNGRPSIARRILTPNELSTLGQVAITNDNENNDGPTTKTTFLSMDEEVLLRFSIKEALYKAMHPLINQFVSFQEAETQPLANGTFNVRLLLKSGAHENFTHVSAHWRRIRCSNNGDNDFFLTSASVQQPRKRRR